MDADVISQDQEGQWLLKRNLEHYTLRDLCSDGSFHLPIGKTRAVPSDSRWDGPFMDLINAPTLALDQPLASLFRDAGTPSPTSGKTDPEPQQEFST
jgi:hypothetical protein